MNDQVIKVNLIPNTGTPAVAKVSQYDVGRPLQFVILDGATRATLAAGTKVYIKGTKPSGLGFSGYKTLGVGGSTITFQTNLAMTQECGRIACELRVVDGDDDIGTANFILAVEKTPHADGTTDGTTEEARTVLEQAQAAANAAAASAEEVAHAGIDASTARNGQVPTADGNGSWSWQAQQGGGGGSVTVDTALSTTSTNPVQNKVITENINSLTDQLAQKGTYSKPSDGIPKSDLDSAVQASLDKADSALQNAPVSSVNGQTGSVVIANATTSAAGLMSATDKSHLDAVYADYSSAITALGV